MFMSLDHTTTYTSDIPTVTEISGLIAQLVRSIQYSTVGKLTCLCNLASLIGQGLPRPFTLHLIRRNISTKYRTRTSENSLLILIRSLCNRVYDLYGFKRSRCKPRMINDAEPSY